MIMIKRKSDCFSETEETDTYITSNRPLFNKIRKDERPSQVVFNSGMCGRKLRYLQKTLDSINLDTLIYDSNKEFLVNVVNQRNSIIAQLIGENIEAIRLITLMDRNYRLKMLRNARSNCHEHDNDTDIEIIAEINNALKSDEIMDPKQFHKLDNTSSLVVPGCDFSDVKFEVSNTSNVTENAELEALISDTAEIINADFENSPNYNLKKVISDYDFLTDLVFGTQGYVNIEYS